MCWSWWFCCFWCVLSRGARASSWAEEAQQQQFRYVYVQDTLDVNCTLPMDSPESVDSLEFTLNNGLCVWNADGLCNISGEEVSRVGEDTLQLNRVVQGTDYAGEYVCWLHTRRGNYDLIGTPLTVFVQYRPRAVEGVVCVAHDWGDRVRCVWHHAVRYNDHSQVEAEPPDDVVVSASLREGPGPSVPCPQLLSTQHSWCQWPGTLFHSAVAAAQFTLEVNVTNSVRQDTAAKVLTFSLRDIVQPSRVRSLRVTDKNSTCVTLSLAHARARAQRRTVYRVNVTHTPHLNSTRLTSHMSSSSSDIISRCGLEPYTLYNVSVECRAADDQGLHGLWSEAKRLVVRTAEKEPGASFEVPPGSYVRHTCNDSGYGAVTVLWKAVPRPQRHGVINGFCLLYYYNSNSNSSSSNNNSNNNINSSNSENNATIPHYLHIPSFLSSLSTSSLSAPSPSSCSSCFSSSSSCCCFSSCPSSPPTSTLLPYLPCTTPVSFRIFASNNAGLSRSYAALRILPDTTRTVPDFAVEMSARGMLRAVWNASKGTGTRTTFRDDDDNDANDDETDDDDVRRQSSPSADDDLVTVFWCERNETAVVFTCLDEIDLAKIEFKAGEMDLTTTAQQLTSKGQGLAAQDLLVGVSRHGQGILWATCLFIPSAEMKAPEGVRAWVVGEEGEVRVVWRAQQCTRTYPVHVTGYRVHVCPRPDHCPGEGSWAVEVDGWQSTRQTVAVEKGVDYVLKVQSLAFGYRGGPLSLPVAANHEPASASLDRPSIVISALVVIVIIVVACVLLYRHCRDSVRHKTMLFAKPKDLVKYHAAPCAHSTTGQHKDHTATTSSSTTTTTTTFLSITPQRGSRAHTCLPHSPASPDLHRHDTWASTPGESRGASPDNALVLRHDHHHDHNPGIPEPRESPNDALVLCHDDDHEPGIPEFRASHDNAVVVVFQNRKGGMVVDEEGRSATTSSDSTAAAVGDTVSLLPVSGTPGVVIMAMTSRGSEPKADRLVVMSEEEEEASGRISSTSTFSSFSFSSSSSTSFSVAVSPGGSVRDLAGPEPHQHSSPSASTDVSICRPADGCITTTAITTTTTTTMC
ncbi:uncharacterized protein LOC143280498 [Babylonia areolata]|uniref:uncharacterized protein LOC143280498 n=1 Tax=Babylonia areolata TaxID=304850 RepID=UPI003FD2F157